MLETVPSLLGVQVGTSDLSLHFSEPRLELDMFFTFLSPGRCFRNIASPLISPGLLTYKIGLSLMPSGLACILFNMSPEKSYV